MLQSQSNTGMIRNGNRRARSRQRNRKRNYKTRHAGNQAVKIDRRHSWYKQRAEDSEERSLNSRSDSSISSTEVPRRRSSTPRMRSLSRDDPEMSLSSPPTRENLLESIRDAIRAGTIDLQDLRDLQEEFGGDNDETEGEPAEPEEEKADEPASSADNAEIDDEEDLGGKKELFVGNLHDVVRQEELAQLFFPFGKVTHIERFETKPIAFVTFATNSSAKKAIKELSGCVVHGRPMRVNFSRSTKRVPSAPTHSKPPYHPTKRKVRRKRATINHSWKCARCGLANRASSPFCFSCKSFRT